MKKEATLKIGDKLYKYVVLKGIFEYTVISIREYTNQSESKQGGIAQYVHYVVRCSQCLDHAPCEVLIVDADTGETYNYVGMLNGYGDDDDEQEEYSRTSNEWYWHGGPDEPFFRTVSKAKEHAYERNLRHLKDDLKAARDKATRIETDIVKCIEAMHGSNLTAKQLDDKKKKALAL